MANALQGSYTRVDGTVVEGPSVLDLVTQTIGDETAAQTLVDKLVEAKTELDVVFAAGENGTKTFDQIIGDSQDHYEFAEAKTPELQALESAITALGQTEAIFTETVNLLSLTNFDADGIGETD